jgi:hypothetical protein
MSQEDNSWGRRTRLFILRSKLLRVTGGLADSYVGQGILVGAATKTNRPVR